MATKKIKPPADIFEFDDADEYETEWRGMPEFNQPDNGAMRQIKEKGILGRKKNE